MIAAAGEEEHDFVDHRTIVLLAEALARRQQAEREPCPRLATACAAPDALIEQEDDVEPEIGLRLPAAGWVPEEIAESFRRMRPLGVLRIGEARQVQEHKAELEGIPTAVFQDVERLGKKLADRREVRRSEHVLSVAARQHRRLGVQALERQRRELPSERLFKPAGSRHRFSSGR
jgi:hypothetical protein